MQVPIYNSDKTRKTCPNGAFVSYPTGTLQKVMVGSALCFNCPLHGIQNSHVVQCLYNSQDK